MKMKQIDMVLMKFFGGHYAGQKAVQKVLRAGLWWPSLFQDVKEYVKCFYVYQRIGKPSGRNEMSLFPIVALEPFSK